MAEMKARFKSTQEFSAALGRASSAGWISIVPQQQSGPVLTPSRTSPRARERLARALALSKLRAGGLNESEVGPEFRELSADLVKRGLVERRESKTVSVRSP